MTVQDMPLRLFKCGKGHTVLAWHSNGHPADLGQFFCPICLGQVADPDTTMDPMLLTASDERLEFAPAAAVIQRKVKPSCRFYGFHAVKENQILVAQGGNQCALVEASYSPCCMEIKGQQPEWATCPLNTPRAAFTVQRLDTYKRHEWAT
jgi:hypothetical protein